MPPGEQIRSAALRCFQYRRLGLLPALWALAFAAGQGRGVCSALLFPRQRSQLVLPTDTAGRRECGRTVSDLRWRENRMAFFEQARRCHGNRGGTNY
jgi:hypothetical protein